MQRERRMQYLEAIGIDLWVSRRDGGASVARGRVPDAPAAEREAAPPAADTAARWEALRSEVLQCTRCPLHLTRTQGVLGVGPKRADWLVIGEAPGAEEDRRGEPFVGAAGQLLDAMLRAIGLDRRTNVYIANVLKSRPPGNRDPRPEEVAARLPYLVRQIALVPPKIMLAGGRVPAPGLPATHVTLSRQLLGYGVMSVGAGEAHILNLCVGGAFRCRGIGKRLLRSLIERAAAAGMGAAFLEVRPSNTAAIRLYLSMGFEQVGSRRGYYQALSGREDAAVLKLALRASHAPSP